MFATIYQHEIKTLFRSRPTLLMLLLLVLSFGFAVWSGVSTVEKYIGAQQFAVAKHAADRELWLNNLIAYEEFTRERNIPMEIAPTSYFPQPYGKPARGTNAGMVGSKLRDVATLPVTGMAAFAIGQMDLQRGYAQVDMDNRFFLSENFEIGNPVSMETGTFDIAFVVLFILPLFIIAITYDLLSGEREAGTLAMVRVQPVSMRCVLGAKICARVSLLLAIVTVCGVAALLYALGQLPEVYTADAWERFALWLAATIIYCLFWFALGVRVNTWRRSSETNATIMASFWLALVVVIPALVSLLSTTIYPAPSRMDLKIAQRAAFAEAEANMDETKRKFFIDHLSMVPEEDRRESELTFLARQQEMEKAVEPVFTQFEIQKQGQESVVSRLQYFSPTIILQRALNDISGTSSQRFDDYMQQVYAYQIDRKNFFIPKFLNQEVMRSKDFADIPQFNYQHETIGSVLARSGMPLAFLLLFVLLVVYPRRISEVGGARSEAAKTPLAKQLVQDSGAG